MTNPDEYQFWAVCPSCKETRSVSASKQQIKQGGQIAVYAMECEHRWTLTQEDSDKLRTESKTVWG